MHRLGKKGSYLVEGALIIPIFILAVLMLMSAVPALSAIENIAFSVHDELRMESAKAGFNGSAAGMKARMKQRITTENPKTEGVRFTHCRYLYRSQGIDDLITVKYRFSYNENDTRNLFYHGVFRGGATARAFTGKRHVLSPDRRSQEEEQVCIFPQWGMRYHDTECTYVRSSCRMTYLTEQLQRGYRSCRLCHAQSAQIGSPVFCFTRSGRAYHVYGCSVITRYYVIIEKGQARTQGYTPCTRCGG